MRFRFPYTKLSVLLLPFLLTGCGIWPVATPSNPQVDVITTGNANVTTPQSTKVVNSSVLEELEQVSGNGQKLVFDAPTSTNSPAFAQLNSFKQGDVVILGPSEKTPYGLLRQVENVQRGSTSWTITTSQATIGQAIEQGTISMSGSFPTAQGSVQSTSAFEGVSAQATGDLVEISFDDVSLFGGDNRDDDPIKLNGRITFGGTFDVRIHVSGFSIREVNFDSEVHENVDLELVGEESLSGFSKEVEVATITFPTFVTPGFPVTITPQLAVTIGAEGDVSIGVTTGITHSATLSFGMDYQGGDWQTTKDRDLNFDFQEPQAQATATLRGNVGPRMKFLIYGVVGPFAEIEAFLEFNAATSPELLAVSTDVLDTPAELVWELWVGLSASVGVDVSIFGIGGVHFEVPDLVEFQQLLAQSETGGDENVAPTIVLDITPTSGPAPLEVSFDASESSDEDGSITDFHWEFGDDSTASGATTSHIYQDAGTYIVTLTVTDDDGATDSTTETIEVTSEGSAKTIAIINPDHYRVVKLGYHIWGGTTSDTTAEYLSLPMGEAEDARTCDGGETNIDCWTGVGGQSDFIGTILEAEGYDVDFFTAASVPESLDGYALVIVQDPITDPLESFPETADETIPGFLDHATASMVSSLKTYFNSGGELLLVGDAVRLLEDSASQPRLDFGKSIQLDNTQHDLSEFNSNLPEQWLFIRGNPFCGLDRHGSGSYEVASSNFVSVGSKLADISLFNGNDIPPAPTWAATVYYPSDGTSLLDVRVQGSGDYVLRGDTCSPPVHTVTVNDVLEHFMGYTMHNGRRVYYLGSDTYFEYTMKDHGGAWHAGSFTEMEFTTTATGRSIIVQLVDNIIH